MGKGIQHAGRGIVCSRGHKQIKSRMESSNIELATRSREIKMRSSGVKMEVCARMSLDFYNWNAMSGVGEYSELKARS